MIRLAFIVSHPIQYYAPLYQRLAQRNDIEIKVFFTWHDAREPVCDSGFQCSVVWDIPLTQGYLYELVPNIARDPGSHHFWGLRNPELVKRVLAWKPDIVHVTGWAWASHLQAIYSLHKAGLPILFRGDSNLLDDSDGTMRWWLKQTVLKRVFSWPQAFLYVGQANQAYYVAFGVTSQRLYYCPHSIDVARFAEPEDVYEREARKWRHDLGISNDKFVILFAGKFEAKKRPIALMKVVLSSGDSSQVLIMLGDGELAADVKELAADHPRQFRVLPFQNQQRMPIVYRLGDLFVLPSGWGETWGLAVNEALACGRPVLVSDRVGCSADVIKTSVSGENSYGSVFRWDNEAELVEAIRHWSVMAARPAIRHAAKIRSRDFDIVRTETTLLDCVRRVML